MMNKPSLPLISVIIPMYNREHSIIKSIDSVLSQDWPSLELIIIDDASTDNSIKIVRKIRDDRIKLLKRSENGGAAAARNDGIRAAKGQYIALLDSDDIFLPGKIKTQVSAMIEQASRYKLSCTALDLELLDENKTVEKYHTYPCDDLLYMFLACDLSPGSTLMVEKRFFEKIGYFDTTLRRFEDWEWLIRATQESPILRVNERLSRVFNVRGRLSDEVMLAASQFIRKRRLTYSNLPRSFHRKADAIVWNQVLITAKHEKKWNLYVKSSILKAFNAPASYAIDSFRSILAQKTSNKLVKDESITTSPHVHKIALIIYDLSPGGAERVITYIANYLNRRGWQVSLIHFRGPDHRPAYEIDPEIQIIPLDIVDNSAARKPRILRLVKYIQDTLLIRKTVKKFGANIAVSFMEAVNIQSIFALVGSGVPVVACERNNPTMHKVKYLIDKFRNISYALAGKVTVQTHEAGEYFNENLRANTVVIQNPIPIGNFERFKHNWDFQNKTIIAIGRLDPQKGFDTLIEAFKDFTLDDMEWELKIYGEGDERANLEQLIAENDLETRITLCGLTDNIPMALTGASIFVLPSRYEGFPNVLLEAMATARPIIATKCKSGPAEIIEHTESGLLVPVDNVKELSRAISWLTTHVAEAEEMRWRAFEKAKTFDQKIIMKKWEQLFLSLL